MTDMHLPPHPEALLAFEVERREKLTARFQEALDHIENLIDHSDSQHGAVTSAEEFLWQFRPRGANHDG